MANPQEWSLAIADPEYQSSIWCQVSPNPDEPLPMPAIFQAAIHGWAETDLGLYGGSNVGYLAALIEPTNIEGILAIDPVATDIINPDAFPTRLFYNPFPKAKTIHWNCGKHPVRVYDALSNKTIYSSVHGSQNFEIPAKPINCLRASGKSLNLLI